MNELFPLTQDTPDIGRIVLEETNLKGKKERNEENNKLRKKQMKKITRLLCRIYNV